MARSDSVILRWAVTTPGGWVTANRAGYIIERYLVDTLGTKSELKILTINALKPWTLDEWKKNSRQDDKLAAVAAQCLYGKNSIKSLENTGKNNDNKANDSYLSNLKYASIELSNKHGFACLAADVDAHAATGLALRFVDKDVKHGASYLYTVKVAKQDTTYFIYEATTFAVIRKNQISMTPPSGLKVIENNSKITLFWANPRNEHYSAYNLYRSDDDGKNPVKLNKSPILPMQPDNMQGQSSPEKSDIPGSFVDSVLINNKTYTYCLRGINMFAEESDCAEIKATPKQQKDLAPTEVTVEQSGIHKATIKWEFNKPESEVQGFAVSRSGNFQNGFQFLHQEPLNKSDREFTDTTANEDEPYYVVTAIDTAGNLFRSIPRLLILIDTVPPTTPTGFHGLIDSNGIVGLGWDLSRESNLLGYRVFWANDSNHKFIMVNNDLIEDNIYQDTVQVRSLSKYIYYKLASVNRRYISSDFTDWIKLKRPSVVPPQQAVFTNFIVTDSSVDLSWEPCRSEDAVKQYLMRRVSGENNWNRIAEFPLNINYYSDKNLSDETGYEYSLETIDESGLKSVTNNFIQAKSQKKTKLTSPTDLQAEYDKSQNAVILKWNSRNSDANSWITIYRSYDNNNGQNNDMQLFETAKSSTNTFKDKSLIGKGKYMYSIVVSTNSEHSEKSKIAEAEVK